MTTPQTLPNRLRRAQAAGSVPPASEFDLNDLCYNPFDGLLFWRDGGGTVRPFDLLSRGLAPIGSPALTGAPTAPTPAAGDGSGRIATTAYADRAAAGAVAAIPAQPVIPAGQCRLAYASATTLKLAPCRGNQVWVGGAYRTIPAAGVMLTNTGLGYGTLQYVYAVMQGSPLALEASTTGHATDGTYGHEIKGGNTPDPTRTYVGMACMAGSSGTGTFVDTPTQRWVASWHNRYPRAFASSNTQQPGTGSSNFVTLTGALNTYVLVHADEVVDASVIGYINGDTQYQYADTTLAIDGAQAGTYIRYQAAAAGINDAVSHRYAATVGEGTHTLSVLGRVNGGGSCSWTIQIYGTIIPGA